MDDTKKCPFCAETIKAEAIKCKHCGSMLGTEIPAASVQTSSPNPTPGNPQPITKLPTHREARGLHAGFWVRVAAYVIDLVIFTFSALILIGLIAGVAALAADGNESGASTIINVAFLFLFWTSCAIFEASPLHATPGKLLLGLETVNSKGERPSIGQAFGRNYGKFLSLIIIDIGFMLAGWTAHKQGLHDLMAGTYVVHKRALSDLKNGKLTEGRPTDTTAAVAIGIIVGAFFLIMFIGILAAIAIPAYQDYIARSQMSEGIQLAGGAEVGLSEYKQNNEKWPGSLEEIYTPASSRPAGRYVDEVGITGCEQDTCGVIATMKDTGVNRNVAGKSVEIWTMDGGSTWQCGPGSINPVEPKFLPAACRDQGAP